MSLVVDGKLGGSYARNMLDAIMQSYCTYYTEKYVEQKLSLNPSRIFWITVMIIMNVSVSSKTIPTICMIS